MNFDEATHRQVTAARPDHSTWLTANAGSGKTRVLTDRVARLLLSGADPQNILCLTYTKAAAGEMQNRLFQMLGRWAMMGEDALERELRGKGVSGVIDLPRARRLFARAIETPGGLKIQTIHSFCSGLLRRFPMEAGVSPQFQEIDERTAEQLRREVLDDMALEKHEALAAFAARANASDFDDLCNQIVSRAELFLGVDAEEKLALALGADPKTSLKRIFETELEQERALLPDLIAALKGGSSSDISQAEKLAPLVGQPWTAARFMTWCSVCLYGEKAAAPFMPRTDRFPTKKTQAAHSALMDKLHPLMERCAEMRPRILAQMAFEQSVALHRFAVEFVPRLKSRMGARGLLGFDDLIIKARDLLTAPDVASWVLWRLDGGIDHILVDEAQDTSPVQWEVIRLLAQEFAAGQGARVERMRTLFVVGDRKQSIYSFQGADPAAFNQMNAYFEERLAAAKSPLTTMSLDHSFRSSPAVLSLVDRVFSGDAAKGLEANVTHLAFREHLPGRVDLWPPVLPEKQDQEEGSWKDPVDRVSPQAPAPRLAAQIAKRIRHMIDHEYLPVERDGQVHLRRINEGDVLILVRRRSALFDAILRAAKKEGLRVAGADRLKLAAEMAVRDIIALLKFLALPEDDLSLATALKSPLFGWSETEIFNLAHSRKGYLWAALRECEDQSKTQTCLQDLRDRADFLRPFELISRLLVIHGGRRKLLARLGAEAEEGIDALLAQAMSYEQNQVPSLTGFLSWLEGEDIEIKRQQGGGGAALRVMTVHGSKGLEAPIVILPDTAKQQQRDRGAILEEQGLAFWRPQSGMMPEKLADAVARARQADAEERRRLLYVALTRAEQWLIVAAAGDPGTEAESWYGMIEGAMGDAQEIEAGFRRVEHGQWRGTLLDAPDPQVQAEIELPPDAALPAPPRPLPAVSPSDLGGAKALPSELSEGPPDRDLAMERGTILHLLLEHLPRVAPEARADLAARIAAGHPDLADRAQALLADPALSGLFEQGRAEVSLTACLPELAGARMVGQIDLLIERPDEVLAIDFKSNRVLPHAAQEIPEGIMRQMGAYAAALSQIYPGRKLRLAILWTENGQLMDVPVALAEAALARAEVT